MSTSIHTTQRRAKSLSMQVNHHIHNEDTPLELATRCTTTTAKVLVASGHPFAILGFQIANSVDLANTCITVLKDKQTGLIKKVSLISYEVFWISFGFLAPTLSEILQDGKNLFRHTTVLVKGDFKAIGDIGMTSLSLISKLYPSPELIVLSISIRILSELGQAYRETTSRKHGWIEGLGCIATAAILGHKNQDHFRYVHRKWTLLSDPKYADLWRAIEEGKRLSKDSPLASEENETLCLKVEKDSLATGSDSLTDTVAKTSAVVHDEKFGKVNLGANYSNIGGDQVKGMVVNCRVKPINGEKITEVNFKVTHVARETITNNIQKIAMYGPELDEFLDYAGVAKSAKISHTFFSYPVQNGDEYKTDWTSPTIGLTKVVEMKGLGKFEIGDQESVTSLYNRVRVNMPEKSTVQDLNIFLCMFGLNQVLKPSTPDQILRMKMGILFRTFYPTQGTQLEQTKAFFNLSTDELKKKMISLAPSMKSHFKSVLPTMKQEEILPGYKHWTIPSIAKTAKKLGAQALTSELTTINTWTTSKSAIKDSCETIASILNIGALSTEERFNAGMPIHGMGSVNDHYMGGSDSVFTRLVTKNPSSGQFNSGISLVYSLDTLNTCTDQYNYNAYGSRKGVDYLYRPNIEDFIKNEVQYYQPKNEVMIKSAVEPKKIVGVVVPNSEWAEMLKDSMRDRNLITKKGNKEYFHGIPLNEYVHTHNTTKSKIVKYA